MKIHEYQAKKLFSDYKIPVSKGELAKTPEDAYRIAKAIGKKVVLKAQIHVGGRGKAGGIQFADTPDEAKKIAKNMFGITIKDLKVKKLLINECAEIEKEFYMSIVLDRQSKSILFMCSEEGGVDIEEVSKKSPDKILKAFINPALGFLDFQISSILRKIFKKKEEFDISLKVARNLYQILTEKDCNLVEINPYSRLIDGRLVALDAKINFDENALYRHPEIIELVDPNEIDPNEEKAKVNGISFVPLDGNIGCIVNGAGLSMATLDVIQFNDGKAANFLDVGGSSNPNKVVAALEIVTSNPNVNCILFNIFGGITRCDDIANGILKSLEIFNVNLPIIIRLTGTNEEEAKKILQNSKFKQLHIIDGGMNEAIELAVKKSKNL